MVEKARKIGIRYVLGWIFGAFLIFVGAILLTESIGGGILIIIGALLIFPPFGGFLERRFKVILTGWLKFIGFLILVGIGIGMIPPEPEKGLEPIVKPNLPPEVVLESDITSGKAPFFSRFQLQLLGS